MNFKIYLRRFGKLITLGKLSRTAGGLYLLSPRNNDYLSYHNDGRYWVRSGGSRFVKKLRQPLTGFSGRETLSIGILSVFGPMPDNPDEIDVRLRKEDIVIDLEGTFCLEIILAEQDTPLPKLADRLNAIVHVKNWQPFIFVEAFQRVDNSFPLDRYPSSKDWVEGTNFFVNHTGRI